MHEQPQHDRPAEAPLDSLGGELAGRVGYAEEEVERDVSYALHLDQHRPDNVALARLTDRLVTHCVTLAIHVNVIPEGQRPQRGVAAVTTWRRLAETGPDDGALGNWSYAKHLAQTGRDMLEALKEHRGAERPARFVGRETLPPVAADTL